MVNPLKTAERRAKSVGAQVARAYRRTGADVPFGNPLPSHGCAMEGWFWRVTDAAAGRVIVALFSVNRHPDGDWSTAAVALHPVTSYGRKRWITLALGNLRSYSP